jgi:hypothetical protein
MFDLNDNIEYKFTPPAYQEVLNKAAVFRAEAFSSRTNV